MPTGIHGGRAISHQASQSVLRRFLSRSLSRALLVMAVVGVMGCLSGPEPAPRVEQVRAAHQQSPEREWRSYLGIPLEIISRHCTRLTGRP